MQGLNFPIPQTHSVITETASRYLHIFFQTAKSTGLAVVSVGSGAGVIEHFASTLYASPICVDNAPGSYHGPNSDELSEVLLKPAYGTVRDLIADQPDLVDNCAVMLIRPPPYHDPMNFENVPYDFESLQALRPRMFIILYKADGGDGTPHIHNALRIASIPCMYDFSPMRDPLTNVIADTAPTYRGFGAYHSVLVPSPQMYMGVAIAIAWRGGAESKLNVLLSNTVLPHGELNPTGPSMNEIKQLLFKSMLATAFKILGKMK